jgi:DNA-binding GntR family transcriptional regulator
MLQQLSTNVITKIMMKDEAIAVKTAQEAGARGTGEPNRSASIYNKLCSDLQDGRYAPGTKLILRDLAQEFDVSLTPVRDALNRLVGERILEMHANRTIAVPIPLAAEVREIRRIRMEIEGFAAAEAAEHVSEAELAAIEADSREYVTARKRKDAQKVREANINFHFGVYAAARMPFLLEMIKGFWLRNGPLQRLLLQSELAPLERSDAYHGAIVEALRNRDPEAARQGIREDIAYPTDAIIVALAELRERQVR